MYNTDNKVNFNLCKKNIVKEAKSSLKIPICVIGGINSQNIKEQVALKPDMIALINGIFDQSDSVEALNFLMDEFLNEEI